MDVWALLFYLLHLGSFFLVPFRGKQKQTVYVFLLKLFPKSKGVLKGLLEIYPVSQRISVSVGNKRGEICKRKMFACVYVYVRVCFMEFLLLLSLFFSFA